MANALANLRSCVKEFQIQDYEESTSNLHKRWSLWIENLEYCFTFEGLDTAPAGGVNPEIKKKAALLALGGQQLRELYNTLEDTETTYTAAKNKISEHFRGSKNLTAERYKFFCMRPLSSQETHDQWATRLKTKGADCEFDRMNLKEAIKLVMTLHTPLPKLQTAIIRDDMTYEQLIKMAQSMELAEREVTYMKNHSMDPKIATTSAHSSSPSSFDLNQLAQYADQQGMKLTPKRTYHRTPGMKPPATKMVEICRYCGEPPPHKNACKARGNTCSNCGRKNHFAKVCENKKINHLAAAPSAPEYTYGAPSIHIHQLETQGERSYPSTYVDVMIGGNKLKMQVDSGADANVIPEAEFRKFRQQIDLHETSAQLKPYNSSNIPIKGTFTTTITVGNKPPVSATFYVSEGSANHSLMGKYTAFDLGVLSINVDKVQHISTTLTEVKHMDFQDMAKLMTPVEDCQKLEQQFEKNSTSQKHKTNDIINHFQDVFTGIGKHKYRRVQQHVDPAVPPVVQAQRRIPFAQRDKLDALLKELEEGDVIEKVEGPTDWVSNIVITPKTDPTKIRMNIDMTTANKAIKRTRHVIPTLEELRYKLNGAAYFSKLDMNHGYNQYEIDPESRHMTVFYTHQGLRQFKRLSFGTNSAAETFHDEMANTLGDIPQVENIYDDILVFGRTQREHDLALVSALQRLEDCGLTCGLDKCQFNSNSVKFFGVIFSKDGIAPDPAKLEALEAFTAPTTATEVRSLLGMTNFCSSFIPDYANITTPLRKLTCKGTEFEWNDECQNAFETLMKLLKGHVTMTYFDPAHETKLTVDGSRKDGLGAILSQKDPDTGIYKPIRFDSRATTAAEKNYSQIEIESLALLFGTTKNHIYLYGLPSYTASTDHQPLLPLYSLHKPDMPARLLRHKLQLQGYNFDLVYEPGETNPSDYMSRHPQPTAARPQEPGDDPLVLATNILIRQDMPKAISTDEIVQATLDDPVLQQLSASIQQGYIANKDKHLSQFKPMFKELSTDDSGLILRSDKIVIPDKLRSRVVAMAHEGHQGIVKTKQLVRSTMWFPGIDKQVEQAVAYCNPCQAATDTKQREPLKPSTLPSQPWMKVNTDLFGPIDGRQEYILVVQDTYSRYPAVELVHSTSYKAVLPAFDKILSEFGIPEHVGSDNGPPYNGTEFSNYAEYMGFHHGPKIPLAPWTNGMVENFMHNLKKLMQTAATEHLNWRQELQRLLRAYRGTPHTVTGRSPAEVLFNGRQYRTRLPATRNAEEPKFHATIQLKQEAHRSAMKRHADNKAYVAESSLQIGDWAMCRQRQLQKKDTPYNATPYEILDITDHGKVTGRSEDGRVITRHRTFFKKILNHPGHGVSCHPPQVQQHFRREESEPDAPLYQQPREELDTVSVAGEGDADVEIAGDEETADDTNDTDTTEAYDMDIDQAIERPARNRVQPARFQDYELQLLESLYQKEE